jgi:geranylgeranyl pyrophosphate synthase
VRASSWCGWIGRVNIRATEGLPRNPGDWVQAQGLADWLELVEGRMRQPVIGHGGRLDEMSLHLLRAPGKRLRSVLVLLNAKGDRDSDKVVAAAAATELLHTASLYHDDIVDGATRRRGLTAANGVWGNRAAAIAGTNLFAASLALFAECGTPALRLASVLTARACSGELDEFANAYNLDLTLDEQLGNLARKTAALFELPCQLGAEIAGFDKSVQRRLAVYGRLVGIAFQLTDDVLDLSAPADVLGKDVGADIRRGIFGGPVILALDHATPGAKRLKDLLGRSELSDDGAREAIGLVADSGALDETSNLARGFSARAAEEADALPGSLPRSALRELATLAAHRDT